MGWQIDRWVDELIDGYVCGWMCEWMDWLVGGCLNGWVGRRHCEDGGKESWGVLRKEFFENGEFAIT